MVGTSNTSAGAGAVAVKNYGSSRDSPTQELADQLDVTLGMLAVTERELARALNVTRHARHLPAARAWHAGP